MKNNKPLFPVLCANNMVKATTYVILKWDNVLISGKNLVDME